jgi:hypothetical protein
MQDLQDKTIKELARECETVKDVHNMLKNLFKDTLQQIFEAEMDEHLGYQKHSLKGNNTGNSRNGYSRKTIQTKLGKTEIDIPRDRNADFEPRVIKKYETTSNDLEDQIIAMSPTMTPIEGIPPYGGRSPTRESNRQTCLWFEWPGGEHPTARVRGSNALYLEADTYLRFGRKVQSNRKCSNKPRGLAFGRLSI